MTALCPLTDLWWPSSVLSGDVAKRRSQSWMTGLWSSSEARHSCVATSGCHASSLHLILKQKHNSYIHHRRSEAAVWTRVRTRDMLSDTLMIGSFLRKSHTTQRPAYVDARMYCTCLFHSIHATSSGGCKHTSLHTIANKPRNIVLDNYLWLLTRRHRLSRVIQIPDVNFGFTCARSQQIWLRMGLILFYHTEEHI